MTHRMIERALLDHQALFFPNAKGKTRSSRFGHKSSKLPAKGG
jgi:hypothetical protein